MTMKTDAYRKRVLQILDFITEITLGNYAYQLDLKNHKDNLEEIVLSLNLMVEEIDTAVHQIDHERSSEVLENMILCLDLNLCITAFSSNFQRILNYDQKEVLGKSISIFISEQSSTYLEAEKGAQSLENREEDQYPFRLEFIHKSGYLWICYAYFHKAQTEQGSLYCLSAFKSIQRNQRIINYLKDRTDDRERYPSEYRSLLLQDKRKILRKLHAYIMANLNTSLPSMSILARTVGGSESKLKSMFKEAYGDTIFKYHKRKRLEKSSILLRDTTLPIGQIAENCGFVSFSHFTRSFKKEYGISPSKIRKF
jgi:AraC-like DNA-binding protein